MLGFICFFIEEVYVGTLFLKKAPTTVKTFFLTICNIFNHEWKNTNGFCRVNVEANFQNENLFHRPCLFVSCAVTTISSRRIFLKAAEHRRTPMTHPRHRWHSLESKELASCLASSRLLCNSFNL